MKTSGPPPQPPELKLLRGNPGHRAIPKGRPRPTAGAVCPPALSPDARREWRRVWPELMRLGLLTRVDRAALAAYCEAWADFIWAVQAIKKEGHVTTAGNGTLIPHPALMVKVRAMQKLRELSAEFGFTPAARARALDQGAPDDPDDDASRFFGGPRPAPAATPPRRRRGPA